MLPSEGIVRYIGVTSDPIRRYREHFIPKEIRKSSRKCAWLRDCIARGEKPVMVLLDCVPDAESRTVEMRWIEHFRRLGVDLVNQKKK
jgi:hypothetical protein